MSPEFWQLLGIVLAPTGAVTVFFGVLGKLLLDRQKSNASDKSEDNANFKALIGVVADGNRNTAQLAKNMLDIDKSHQDDMKKMNVSIVDNGKKLDVLDKTVSGSSDDTIAQLDTLSNNLTSQFLAIQKQLEIVSKSFVDNESQHAQINALIKEFEGLVSRLNIITEAKEKTQPIPDLEDILSVPPTDNIESEDTHGSDS